MDKENIFDVMYMKEILIQEKFNQGKYYKVNGKSYEGN